MKPVTVISAYRLAPKPKGRDWVAGALIFLASIALLWVT